MNRTIQVLVGHTTDNHCYCRRVLHSPCMKKLQIYLSWELLQKLYFVTKLWKILCFLLVLKVSVNEDHQCYKLTKHQSFYRTSLLDNNVFHKFTLNFLKRFFMVLCRLIKLLYNKLHVVFILLAIVLCSMKIQLTSNLSQSWWSKIATIIHVHNKIIFSCCSTRWSVCATTTTQKLSQHDRFLFMYYN